jgi:L-methionine (R)-S-oxide reductase
LKDPIADTTFERTSVACQTITLGKGVCGTAAVGKDGSGKGETLVVRDVEQFPGHIACDGESKSEIVVPIRANEKVSDVSISRR